MKIRISTIISIVSSAACLILAASEAKKSAELSKKLDMSIDELARKTPTDISESMFNAAVQRSVDREVRSQVANAVTLIKKEVSDEMKSIIKADVHSAYEETHGKVNDRVDAEINRIDFDEMKKDIRRKIESKMFDKLLNISGIGNLFSGGGVRYDRYGNRIDEGAVQNILNSFTFDSDRLRALKTIYGKDNY